MILVTMAAQSIIEKLKASNLLGRGGAAYPTWQKWTAVKEAKADKKYIICNASEGEPGVYKDGFILENYPEELINGLKIALETIDHSRAYLYLRHGYYQRFKKNLEKLTRGLPITLFEKSGHYISGEETTVIATIEGKRQEPSLKPPFPTQAGLWGYPTLINNVETFYYVSKIEKDSYHQTRLYSVNGEVENGGVYELPLNWPIEKVLKETKNWPGFDFFVQAGGGAAGEILLPEELGQPIAGAGAIIVYHRQKTNPLTLMKKWAIFFMDGNCDKCVPCREGVFRIAEMLESEKVDRKIIDDLCFVLEKTSFCPLGRSTVIAFRSLTNKLLSCQYE